MLMGLYCFKWLKWIAIFEYFLSPFLLVFFWLWISFSLIIRVLFYSMVFIIFELFIKWNHQKPQRRRGKWKQSVFSRLVSLKKILYSGWFNTYFKTAFWNMRWNSCALNKTIAHTYVSFARYFVKKKKKWKNLISFFTNARSTFIKWELTELLCKINHLFNIFKCFIFTHYYIDYMFWLTNSYEIKW